MVDLFDYLPHLWVGGAACTSFLYVIRRGAHHLNAWLAIEVFTPVRAHKRWRRFRLHRFPSPAWARRWQRYRRRLPAIDVVALKASRRASSATCAYTFATIPALLAELPNAFVTIGVAMP